MPNDCDQASPLSSKSSSWAWKIFYFNPEDSRLWVPGRIGLGWNINLAHPKAKQAMSALMWALIALQTIAALVLTGASEKFSQLGHAALFVAFSGIAALVVFRFSGTGVETARPSVEWAWYGLLAFGLGIGLQVIMNGGMLLLLKLKTEQLTWKHHLYFGPMAGICQTLGKLGMVRAATLFRKDDALSTIRMGLIVGLGFTLWEILFVGLGAIRQGGPIELGLGVWERTSSAVFHIYAGGLIGVALATKRYGWVWFVLLMHGTLDWFAGSVKSFSMSMVMVEAIIFAAAALTWSTFMVASKSIRH